LLDCAEPVDVSMGLRTEELLVVSEEAGWAFLFIASA
jgi:hypothetical protein